MAKFLAILVILGGACATVAAVSSGCSSTTNSTTLADCSSSTPPDAGMNAKLTCAILWSCNSGDTQLQLTCTQDKRPEYYDCTCSNGSTTTETIVVDTFPCDPNNPMGALPTANMGCNFNILP
jgi:hypothetical protein